ncbi:MAG TPA: DUF3618 domain-containing protein [Polyangiaceae bacterium]|nr:DUF3618 domain-containing protein [Polyangiaceae bacterium]
MTEHEQSGSRSEDTDKSSDDLRAEVEQTRERLSREVEAIGTKLSPEHIKTEAKRVIKDKVDRGEQQIRQKVGTAADSVSSFVGENPIPLALIGAGLGWLLYNARSKQGERGAQMNYAAYGRSEVWDDFGNDSSRGGSSAVRGVERKLHQLRDKVRDGAETVKHSASEKANFARQKVNQLEHAAHDELDRARDVATNTFAEQPLLLGAVALGVGIAVGLGLPATESENHLVGQYRDKLVSRAKDQLGELRDKAENVARQTFESAKDTAKAGTEELLGTQSS